MVGLMDSITQSCSLISQILELVEFVESIVATVIIFPAGFASQGDLNKGVFTQAMWGWQFRRAMRFQFLGAYISNA